jgi:hypothetical protein
MAGFCKPGNKFTGKNMTCIHFIFETLGFTDFLQFQKVDDLKNHRANYTCAEKGQARACTHARTHNREST